MYVNQLASSLAVMPGAETAQTVQLAVLKKAINLQADGVMQLVQATTQAGGSNPPHLGNKLNTFA